MLTDDGLGEMWEDVVVAYCKGLSSHLPGGTAMKDIRIVCLLADIQTRYLPNMKQE
jgi:hypothetical protein